MISIQCQAGYLGAIQGMPVPFDDAPGAQGMVAWLRDLFWTNSAADIDFRLLPPQVPHIEMGNQAALSSRELHEFLSRLTGNPVAPGPTSKIGIIYASDYAPFAGVFGVMFDRGFQVSHDQGLNAVFSDKPREGCAVFLNAIDRDRPDAYQEQVRYTSGHELGHVFNLGHQNDSANLMRESVYLTNFSAANYRYSQSHQGLLCQCSSSIYIQPGGGRYGDLGTLGQPFFDGGFDGVEDNRLKMSLAVKDEEFWPFEPVELDVTLGLAPGARGPVVVPEQLDPGYKTFTIWIRSPDGEVRRYRATKHYCAGIKTHTITRRNPYRRDISIFGQSGGYTFSQAGTHEIWAVFQSAPDRRVTSEVISVCVKPAKQRSLRFKRREHLHRAAAFGLYYRTGPCFGEEVQALIEMAKTFRKEASGAAANYAIGRIFWDQFQRQKGPRDRHLEKQVKERLKRASQHDSLSCQRRRNAEAILQRF
ncbi:MAG: hypothetical protein CJBNEKGG_03944 [Prosthecobacter sp.]|nr:hypothetical protein [Prosthecobacter sp.]